MVNVKAPQAIQAFARVLQNDANALTILQNSLARDVRIVALDNGTKTATSTPAKVVSLITRMVLPNAGGALDVTKTGNGTWKIEAYISRPHEGCIITADCTLRDDKIVEIFLESTRGTYVFIL